MVNYAYSYQKMTAKLEQETTKAQKNYEIFRASSDAIVMHFDNISVCIFSIDDNGKIIEIGSGTCVNIGTEYLIATAAHVIKDYRIENLHIISSGTPSNIILHPDAKGYEGGTKDDDVDIGYLKLSKQKVEQIGTDFIGIDRIGSSVNGDKVELVVVSGYPAEFSSFDEVKNHLNVMPIAYHTHSLNVESVGGNATHDLYFDYPKDGNEIFGEFTFNKLPDAPGLSGGGFWRTNITKKEGIWSTNDMKLIGIDESWNERERWIRGTQIQHWLHLIRRDMPNLRDDIDDFLDE